MRKISLLVIIHSGKSLPHPSTVPHTLHVWVTADLGGDLWVCWISHLVGKWCYHCRNISLTQEIPVAAALAWCIWGSRCGKVRDLCEKSCEILFALEMCWWPAVCFARGDVRISLARGEKEGGEMCKANTALTWESALGPVASRVQHNAQEKGMLAGGVTSRADYTGPSHGNHFICFGIQFLWWHKTDSKPDGVMWADILGRVPALEPWKCVGWAYKKPG